MAAWLRGDVVLGVLVLIIMATGRGRCSAAQAVHHVVGGDQGWDAASNIAAWSSRRSFRVGDNIWFTYSAAKESIIELRTQAEFESCNVTNPIRMYTGGLERVSLDQEGSRYFVSSTQESCYNGLKLHVQVQVLTPAAARSTVTTVAAAAAPQSSGSNRLASPVVFMLYVGLAVLSSSMGYHGV